MHLLVSPLCAPPEYVERFAFIRERYDDPDHARQYVAAMTSLLDDIVGDVVAALHTAGLWENTLFVWSSDNGGAIELDTGMKNNYPLVNAAEPFLSVLWRATVCFSLLRLRHSTSTTSTVSRQRRF